MLSGQEKLVDPPCQDHVVSMAPSTPSPDGVLPVVHNVGNVPRNNTGSVCANQEFLQAPFPRKLMVIEGESKAIVSADDPNSITGA